jgi:hypothetical protein
MPSTDAPNWWADVQQEREDLAGPGRRPAEDWLGEDIDFVPRRRLSRRRGADVAHDRVEAATATERADADHPLHGVFVASADGETATRAADSAARVVELTGTATGSRTVELTGTATGSRTVELTGADTTGSRTIELTMADDVVLAEAPADVAHELAHLSAADDPFASPPPPAGRRTVQIKGRPTHLGIPSMAQRHRGRTASDRVGPRPDRIALWAVALGAILILLAAMTSSSQAAVHAPRVYAAAANAHVVHVHHTAPVRAFKHH